MNTENPFLTSNPPKTVQELFEDASRWTKGENYIGCRDWKGELVHHRKSPSACCFCLGAAIGLVYPGDVELANSLSKALKVLRNEYHWFGSIPEWNDHSETTIDDVRNVARLANI